MAEPRPTILAIEDDPSLQKFLRVTLENQNYNVIEASRGEEGLRHASVGQPDLIILDLGLPDLDGVEVTSGFESGPEYPSSSCPREAKRQVYSLPSAERRARLQSRQKGCVTEAMMPISPPPSR